MSKPGSIRKVDVTNFVTYSHVEMYPGPHLNMIIGPNGTGKSTMVAAIILGLGGSPKVVGRGTKIAEYVKHNCESATINIYLQGNREKDFIKVTRQFDTRDKTVWKLNNERVTLEQVLQCIKTFDIQVNNLCQFLPQDRVQDFAKLNKQELLCETQKALCRFDLVEKQESLIKCRDNHRELIALIENCRQKLQEAQDANIRLEGRVQSFNKKKKYDEIINNIERKIAWVTYEKSKGEVEEVKKDRKKAQEIFEKYKRALKPMENQVNEMKKKISDLQQYNNKTNQVMRHIESSISSNLERVETFKSSLRRLEDDVNLKLAEVEQWDKEIQNATTKLEEIRVAQKESHAKLTASNQERQGLSSELTKVQGVHGMIQDKKEEISQKKQEEVTRIRSLEHELTRLENVKQSRFQYLERIDQDCAAAVKWLRNNKDMFEDQIFEPFMLEANVLDNQKAKYVENVIPMRDRLAFTCVNINDMNKLVTCLRKKQNLAVNVIHSGNDRVLSQFQPNIPIEHLRKYGFYTYISNLFTAPEPIMCYLCKSYNIHNIPVGDHTTNNYYEQLPSQIRFFFSDKYRFSINCSKYSGQKSTRQIEVRSDGGLSFSLDVVRLNKLKGEINDLQKKVQNYEAQYNTCESQIEKIREKEKALKEKFKQLQQDRQHAQAIDAKVQTTLNKIQEMQSLKKSPDAIKAEAINKKKTILKNMPAVSEAIKNEYKKLCSIISKADFSLLKIETERDRLDFIQNEMAENKRHADEAEQQLNVIKDKYAEIMTQAKAFLTKAKSLSKGFTPADDEFQEFKAEYDALPWKMEQLNSVKEQYLTRIDCLNIADNAEIKEYEDRVEEINRLQDKVERSNAELNKIISRMGRMHREWLMPLNELISKINEKFSMAFNRMGCAGEIAIDTGEDEQDFEKYGLSVKVSYRSGEPLQELNSNIQSGGERAVATAAYMLSLQELTPVPFRCVDEINQGMDADNERRIFELIVESTCQPNSSQYFLITPKLVPHLRYSPNMAVHIVHNGPFIKPDRKWSFSKLCNPENVQVA